MKQRISDRRLNIAAENITVKMMEQQGIKVELSKDDGYILANGKRVVVKASTYRPKGYRFITTVPAKIQFIMCVCFNDELEIDKFYLLPKKVFESRTKMHFQDGGHNSSRYMKYQNSFTGISK